MLVIRQKQIDSIMMDDEEQFITFIVSHEKQEHPQLEEKREPEKLREMAKAGIERAKSHGFKTSDDIMAFISIMFEIAPNFDEQADIQKVLDDEDSPAARKFDNLWSPLVPDEAWEEAEEKYDEEAWLVKEAEVAETAETDVEK